MLPSIATSSSGPLEPGRIAPVAALDQPILADAHHDEHVAAKGLDQSEPLSHAAGLGALGVQLALGKTFENLIDQLQALLDLADADPHPRIDVAVVAHRRLELKLVIGGISHRLARIESAA